MRRFFLRGLAAAAVAALAFAPSTAKALRIAMPIASTKVKTIQADAVIVGTVTGIEKETVDLEQFPGSNEKVPHTVANIKIESTLLGNRNITHLKLVFVKPGAEEQPGGGIIGGPGGGPAVRPLPFPGRGGLPTFIPAEKQEGLFFLQKHPTSPNHYVVQMGHNPILSNDPKYADELALVKVVTGALANPVKALKAENPDDRLSAALALAQKYRLYPANNPSGVFEETAIPAEQSKLFLQVLAECDWSKNADAARLADALGLMPGNYGMPRLAVGDDGDLLAARQKAFKLWYEKFGDKFEVKQISAKPVTEKQPDTRQPLPGRPMILPAVPPQRGGR